MIKLEIYSKENCCLCEQANVIVEKLSQQYPLEVVEIDITKDLIKYKEYEHSIPVVIMNGEIISFGNVDELSLKKAIDNSFLKNTND